MTEPATITPDTTAAPTTAAEAGKWLESRPAEWREKLLAGGVSERKEFDKATELSSAASRIDAAMSKDPQIPWMEVTDAEHPFTTRQIASAVAGLRENGVSDPAIKELLAGRNPSDEERHAVERFRDQRLGDPEFVGRLLSGKDREAQREFTLWSIVLSAGAPQAI